MENFIAFIDLVVSVGGVFNPFHKIKTRHMINLVQLYLPIFKINMVQYKLGPAKLMIYGSISDGDI